MVIQRGTMSRCQGLSHFVREVFLDFDKTDRLVDCSHEFTRIEFIKRGGCFSIPIPFYLLLEKCGYRSDNRYSHRDIVLNLRIYREVSEVRVGLHRENYFCKRNVWRGMNSHIRMQ